MAIPIKKLALLFGFVLIASVQASASDLINLEKDTLSIPVKVSVVGEGKNATHWQAIRKAQMQLAQELPSVIHYTSTMNNTKLEVIVHETLAQTVSMHVDSIKQNVYKLGTEYAPEYAGSSHNRYDKNLDDGGNPLGTLYKVDAQVTFLVIPAALVERAKIIENNRQLVQEMERKSQGDAIGHYHSNLLLLERLNQDASNNAKLNQLEQSLSQHMQTKNFSAGLDALSKSIDGAGRIDIQTLDSARREGDLSYYRNRDQDVGRQISQAHLERKQQLDSFVKSLPAAYANTFKVVGVELIDPPTKRVRRKNPEELTNYFARYQEISTIGSFGADFNFAIKDVDSFKRNTGLQFAYEDYNPSYVPPPTQLLNIRLDPTCELNKAPRSNARLNLCELWQTLPQSLLNRFAIEGLYGHDYLYNMDNLKLFLEGGDRSYGTRFSDVIYRMPSAFTGTANVKVIDGVNQIGDPDAEAIRIYYYSDTTKVIPSLFAAGFAQRPPVTLTVMFPSTKEYLDIILNSEDVLLRPRFISLVLQDEDMTPELNNLRQQDIRAVVWWSGDNGEIKHPAKGFTRIKGGLHYANVSSSSDGQQLKHLKKLRDGGEESLRYTYQERMQDFYIEEKDRRNRGLTELKYDYEKATQQFNRELKERREKALFIQSRVDGLDRVYSYYRQPQVLGWYKNILPKLKRDFEHVIVLQYGRIPDGLLSHHDLDTSSCNVYHPEIKWIMACDYYSSMEYPPRKTFIPFPSRNRDFFKAIENGHSGFGNLPPLRKEEKEKDLPSRTYFRDPYTGKAKYW